MTRFERRLERNKALHETLHRRLATAMKQRQKQSRKPKQGKKGSSRLKQRLRGRPGTTPLAVQTLPCDKQGAIRRSNHRLQKPISAPDAANCPPGAEQAGSAAVHDHAGANTEVQGQEQRQADMQPAGNTAEASLRAGAARTSSSRLMKMKERKAGILARLDADYAAAAAAAAEAAAAEAAAAEAAAAEAAADEAAAAEAAAAEAAAAEAAAEGASQHWEAASTADVRPSWRLLQDAQDTAQKSTSPALPLGGEGSSRLQGNSKHVRSAPVMTEAEASTQQQGLAERQAVPTGVVDPFGLLGPLTDPFGLSSILAVPPRLAPALAQGNSPPNTATSHDSAASVSLGFPYVDSAPQVPDSPVAVHTSAPPAMPAPTPALPQLSHLPTALPDSMPRQAVAVKDQSLPGAAALGTSHKAIKAPASNPVFPAAQETTIELARQEPMQSSTSLVQAVSATAAMDDHDQLAVPADVADHQVLAATVAAVNAAATEGSAAFPDGSVETPQGSPVPSHGTAEAPQGSAVAPDGNTAALDGDIAAPDGDAAAPNEAMTRQTVMGAAASPAAAVTAAPSAPAPTGPAAAMAITQHDEAGNNLAAGSPAHLSEAEAGRVVDRIVRTLTVESPPREGDVATNSPGKHLQSLSLAGHHLSNSPTADLGETAAINAEAPTLISVLLRYMIEGSLDPPDALDVGFALEQAGAAAHAHADESDVADAEAAHAGPTSTSDAGAAAANAEDATANADSIAAGPVGIIAAAAAAAIAADAAAYHADPFAAVAAYIAFIAAEKAVDEGSLTAPSDPAVCTAVINSGSNPTDSVAARLSQPDDSSLPALLYPAGAVADAPRADASAAAANSGADAARADDTAAVNAHTHAVANPAAEESCPAEAHPKEVLVQSAAASPSHQHYAPADQDSPPEQLVQPAAATPLPPHIAVADEDSPPEQLVQPAAATPSHPHFAAADEDSPPEQLVEPAAATPSHPRFTVADEDSPPEQLVQPVAATPSHPHFTAAGQDSPPEQLVQPTSALTAASPASKEAANADPSQQELPPAGSDNPSEQPRPAPGSIASRVKRARQASAAVRLPRSPPDVINLISDDEQSDVAGEEEEQQFADEEQQSAASDADLLYEAAQQAPATDAVHTAYGKSPTGFFSFFPQYKYPVLDQQSCSWHTSACASQELEADVEPVDDATSSAHLMPQLSMDQSAEYIDPCLNLGNLQRYTEFDSWLHDGRLRNAQDFYAWLASTQAQAQAADEADTESKGVLQRSQQTIRSKQMHVQEGKRTGAGHRKQANRSEKQNGNAKTKRKKRAEHKVAKKGSESQPADHQAASLAKGEASATALATSTETDLPPNVTALEADGPQRRRDLSSGCIVAFLKLGLQPEDTLHTCPTSEQGTAAPASDTAVAPVGLSMAAAPAPDTGLPMAAPPVNEPWAAGNAPDTDLLMAAPPASEPRATVDAPDSGLPMTAPPVSEHRTTATVRDSGLALAASPAQLQTTASALEVGVLKAAASAPGTVAAIKKGSGMLEDSADPGPATSCQPAVESPQAAAAALQAPVHEDVGQAIAPAAEQKQRRKKHKRKHSPEEQAAKEAKRLKRAACKSEAQAGIPHTSAVEEEQAMPGIQPGAAVEGVEPGPSDCATKAGGLAEDTEMPLPAQPCPSLGQTQHTGGPQAQGDAEAVEREAAPETEPLADAESVLPLPLVAPHLPAQGSSDCAASCAGNPAALDREPVAQQHTETASRALPTATEASADALDMPAAAAPAGSAQPAEQQAVKREKGARKRAKMERAARRQKRAEREQAAVQEALDAVQDIIHDAEEADQGQAAEQVAHGSPAQLSMHMPAGQLADTGGHTAAHPSEGPLVQSAPESISAGSGMRPRKAQGISDGVKQQPAPNPEPESSSLPQALVPNPTADVTKANKASRKAAKACRATSKASKGSLSADGQSSAHLAQPDGSSLQPAAAPKPGDVAPDGKKPSRRKSRKVSAAAGPSSLPAAVPASAAAALPSLPESGGLQLAAVHQHQPGEEAGNGAAGPDEARQWKSCGTCKFCRWDMICERVGMQAAMEALAHIQGSHS